MGIDEQTLKQIIKSIINWNRQPLEFDKKFLSYQDEFCDLAVEDDGSTIRITTVRK